MAKIPLLDLGNVIVKVDFHPFLSWLESQARRTVESKALLTSSLFYDFEFGNLSRDEFRRRVGEWTGCLLDRAEFETNFCAIFPSLVDGVEEAMDRLKGQGPVYCLSNTNEIHLEYINKHYPIMKKFDRVFASHEIQKRKPYPGIYHFVADALDLETKDMVFFDDVAQNVEGAKKVGMEAHVFLNVSDMLERLKGS